MNEWLQTILEVTATYGGIWGMWWIITRLPDTYRMRQEQKAWGYLSYPEDTLLKLHKRYCDMFLENKKPESCKREMAAIEAALKARRKLSQPSNAQ